MNPFFSRIRLYRLSVQYCNNILLDPNKLNSFSKSSNNQFSISKMETDNTSNNVSNFKLLDNFIQDVRQENENKRKMLEMFSSNNEIEDINMKISQQEIGEIASRLKTSKWICF